MKNPLITRSLLGIFVGLFFGVLYTVFWPAMWQAHMEIVVPQQTPGGGGLAAALQQLGASAGSNIYIVKSILESQNAIGEVAKSTKQEKKYVDGHTDVKEDAVANTIKVDVKDRNQRLALAMCSRYLIALRRISSEIGLPDKHKKLRAMETQLLKAQARLAFAEKRQKKLYSAIRTAPQVTASASAAGFVAVVSPGTIQGDIGQLQVKLRGIDKAIGEIVSKAQVKAGEFTAPNDLPPSVKWRETLNDLEFQLKTAEITAGPKDPNVVALKQQIEKTKGTLKQELELYANSIKKGLIDPTAGSQNKDLADVMVDEVATTAELNATQEIAKLGPEEALSLQTVLNEVGTESLIVEQYRTNIEQAKVDELSDQDFWEILDAPALMDEPINKDWKKNLTFGAVIGLLAGLILSRRRVDKIEAEAETE